MKSSKINEYKNMSVEQLQKELKELKNELFKLRFQNSLNGLDNPKKITLVKKEIARVSTLITEKENN
jgi:large subunit ribosomal protein L29